MRNNLFPRLLLAAALACCAALPFLAGCSEDGSPTYDFAAPKPDQSVPQDLAPTTDLAPSTDAADVDL